MSYMTESNWLTMNERQSAKLENEDGELDDKNTVNLQAREERVGTRERIQTASLPGHCVRRVVASKEFVPGLLKQDFRRIDSYYTPSRTINPSAFSAPQSTSIEPESSSSSLTALRVAQIASSVLDHD